MTTEIPKLKLMVIGGHTWYSIDKDRDNKTKSASMFFRKDKKYLKGA